MPDSADIEHASQANLSILTDDLLGECSTHMCGINPETTFAALSQRLLGDYSDGQTDANDDEIGEWFRSGRIDAKQQKAVISLVAKLKSTDHFPDIASLQSANQADIMNFAKMNATEAHFVHDLFAPFQ